MVNSEILHLRRYRSTYNRQRKIINVDYGMEFFWILNEMHSKNIFIKHLNNYEICVFPCATKANQIHGIYTCLIPDPKMQKH